MTHKISAINLCDADAPQKQKDTQILPHFPVGSSQSLWSVRVVSERERATNRPWLYGLGANEEEEAMGEGSIGMRVGNRYWHTCETLLEIGSSPPVPTTN